MGKHRDEGDFTDEELDRLWDEMEEEADKDPEDDDA